MALTLLTGLALTALISPAHADGADDYLQAQRTARHIPGLSVAVVQDGKVVKAQGYGTSGLAAKTPATADTVYQIASLTKQFTAAAILSLMQQGKLGADDPITRYLDGLPPAWNAITVRELLNQTSGLPDYMAGFDLSTQTGTKPKDYSAADLIGLVSRTPLLFAPGTQFAYSNTNYHLLGMIVEKASGKSYGAFMHGTFFGPLGMTHTQMARPGLRVPDAAQGALWNGSGLEASPFALSPTLSFGDNGVQTTVTDLVKWDAALDGDTLLTPVSKRLLWTSPALPAGTGGVGTGYAAGWFAAKEAGHPLLWHNGGTFSGFTGAIFKFPADHLTLIVLTNSLDLPGLQSGGYPLYALTLGLAKLYLPDLAKADTGIPDSDPQTAALLRTVSAQLASGTLDKSLFAPAFQALLTPAATDPAHALLAPLGPMTSLALLRRAPDGSALYRALYGPTAVKWLVAVDKDHKIVLLRPLPE